MGRPATHEPASAGDHEPKPLRAPRLLEIAGSDQALPSREGFDRQLNSGAASGAAYPNGSRREHRRGSRADWASVPRSPSSCGGTPIERPTCARLRPQPDRSKRYDLRY